MQKSQAYAKKMSLLSTEIKIYLKFIMKTHQKLKRLERHRTGLVPEPPLRDRMIYLNNK